MIMIKKITVICLVGQAVLSQQLQVCDNNILNTASKLKPIQSIIIGYLGFEKTNDNVDWSVDCEELNNNKREHRPNPEVSLIEVESGKKYSLMRINNGFFTTKRFSPDSKYFAAGATTANVSLANNWLTEQILNGKNLLDIVCSNIDKVYKCTNTNVYIWELQTRKKVATLKKLDAPVIRLVFCPVNSKLICICENGTIQIFDITNIKNAALMHTIKHNRVQSAATSQNGLYLATYSCDDIKIWDAKTYALLQTLDFPWELEIELDIVTFSPDSLYIQGKQKYDNSENDSSFVAYTWKNQAAEVALASSEPEHVDSIELKPAVKKRSTPCSQIGCTIS